MVALSAFAAIGSLMLAIVSIATLIRRPLAGLATGRHVVLVANGSASVLGGNGGMLEGARLLLLERRGARVETRLTESVAELQAPWPEF